MGNFLSKCVVYRLSRKYPSTQEQFSVNLKSKLSDRAFLTAQRDGAGRGYNSHSNCHIFLRWMCIIVHAHKLLLHAPMSLSGTGYALDYTQCALPSSSSCRLQLHSLGCSAWEMQRATGAAEGRRGAGRGGQQAVESRPSFGIPWQARNIAGQL